MRTIPLLLAILTSTSALAAGAAQASAADTARAPRRDRIAQCSWDRPGRDPFMGDVVAAIDRYSDIPTAVRVRLKQRMQARKYDDLVDIRRDSIRGKAAYEPEIRDMHFGMDRVCHQVSRSGWSERMHERGLVYCEQGHCILIPTVCRNVSRITRRPSAVAAARLGEAPADALPPGAPAPAVEPAALPPDTLPRRAVATSSITEAVAGESFGLEPPRDWVDPQAGFGGLPVGGGGFATFDAPRGGWAGGGGGDSGASGRGGGIPAAGAPGPSGNGGPAGPGPGPVSIPGSGPGPVSIPAAGPGPGSIPGPGSTPGSSPGADPYPYPSPFPYPGPDDDPAGPIVIEPGPYVPDPPAGPFPSDLPPGFPAPGGGGPTDDIQDSPAAAVPEPATWASLLAGLLALGIVSAARRRRG